jgi:hypothetical protein
LVKKIKLDIYIASTTLDAWLGTNSIEGGSIKDKEPLCIEVGPTIVSSKVEEVLDSDIESESSIDSDSEEVTIGTSY